MISAKLSVFFDGTLLKDFNLQNEQVIILGRDPHCDIFVQDTRISRRHVEFHWTSENLRIRSLSKHAKVLKNGVSIDGQSIVDDTELVIGPCTVQLAFQKEKTLASQIGVLASNNIIPAALDAGDSSSEFIPQPTHSTEVANDFDEEKTNHGQGLADLSDSQNLVPYLSHTSLVQNSKDRYRLDGSHWILGRDQAVSQISFSDLRWSRRHLKISKNSGVYSVEDLGSTHGTSVNGKSLQAGYAHPLESGDQIQVGDDVITFELVYPNFDRQLQLVPAELRQPLITNPLDELPVFHGPQGGEFSDPYLSAASKLNQKTKAIRFAIVFGVAALISAYLFSSGPSPAPTTSTTSSTGQSDSTRSSHSPAAIFDQMTSQQKDVIVSSYNLADTFLKRRNFEAALRELGKIHEMIPSYLQSRDFEESARRAIEAQAQRRTLKEQSEKEALVKQETQRAFAICRDQFKSFRTLDDLTRCLSKVTDLDPGFEGVKDLVQRFEIESQKKVADQKRQADQELQIKKGRELYEKALALKKAGQTQRAIAAFDAHLHSPTPDPGQLKVMSKKEISDLQAELKQKADALVAEAQNLFKDSKPKIAVEKIDSALEISPTHEEAKKLRSTITTDLYRKMKVIYGDSVLLESLGNIDEAKEKWKAILDTDISSGEYFQKAKIKMARYGEK